MNTKMTPPRLRLLFTLISLSCMLSGCVELKPQIPELSNIRTELPDAKYRIKEARTKEVQLKNGCFYKNFGDGASDLVEIRLLEDRAFGDINGDGLEDAIVALEVETGGSGVFCYLELMINQNGNPKALPAVYLGDRIKIKSLKIQPAKVVVTILDRKLDEGFDAVPTVEIRRVFKLEGKKLVEIK